MSVILFDLDGTLVDTSGDLCEALNHVLGQRGMRPVAQTVARAWVGEGAARLITKGLQQQGCKLSAAQLQTAVDDFLTFYSRHLSTFSVLYPSVVKVLTALSLRGYRLAVCTNKPHALAVALLEQLGIRHFFSVVHGYRGDDIRKPDERFLRFIFSTLGIAPSRQSVMIGDTHVDQWAAQACGLAFIGVSFGYGMLKAEDCDIFLANYEGCVEAVMGFRRNHHSC